MALRTSPSPIPTQVEVAHGLYCAVYAERGPYEPAPGMQNVRVQNNESESIIASQWNKKQYDIVCIRPRVIILIRIAPFSRRVSRPELHPLYLQWARLRAVQDHW